ncbi:MAG: LPP20 family lipoprotein [Tidjanibacter sp.]|nr:LPP20 family lipoprotein [Tidjanibacter sp.]
MKKFYMVLVVAMTGMMLTSCSFGGKMFSPDPRVEVKLSEAQEYANSAPKGVLRAVGEATGVEQGWTAREATAMARANLAEQISAKVISGVEMYRNSYTKTAITKDEVKTVKDSEGGDQQSILQVCEQSVSGARPVKTSTYMLPNGTYQIFVCVEADVESVAQYVTENDTVQQLISDDERVKIEYNRDQFRQRINEALAQ